jgi:hypothetical protein
MIKQVDSKKICQTCFCTLEELVMIKHLVACCSECHSFCTLEELVMIKLHIFQPGE